MSNTVDFDHKNYVAECVKCGFRTAWDRESKNVRLTRNLAPEPHCPECDDGWFELVKDMKDYGLSQKEYLYMREIEEIFDGVPESDSDELQKVVDDKFHDLHGDTLEWLTLPTVENALKRTDDPSTEMILQRVVDKA